MTEDERAALRRGPVPHPPPSHPEIPPPMPASGPFPTRHVLDKIRARNVTWGEILEVIQQPEVTYGPDHQGRMNLQRGNLAVILADNGAVVTVLLRSTEQWTDEDARRREEIL